MTGTRTVLVTGAGSGIGRAVARAVVQAGGRVAAAGRRVEPLEELRRELGDGVVPLPTDLTSGEHQRELVPRAARALGGLDGLVHAAGVIVREPVGAISEAALREMLEIHVVAALRLGEQAVARLEPGGGIVLVASNLAARPLPETPVYSACKAAMVSISRSLALAGAPRRVRCSAVLPGVVDTDMQGPERLSALSALHPLGRAGSPDEVAQAVLHLLAAPWTTGAELTIDGGLSLRGA